MKLITSLQQCKYQNWRLNIRFRVFGKDDNYFGDGLAIWYAKDRLIPGPVFGSKDYFHGLAIILHTHTVHNGLQDVRIEKMFTMKIMTVFF